MSPRTHRAKRGGLPLDTPLYPVACPFDSHFPTHPISFQIQGSTPVKQKRNGGVACFFLKITCVSNSPLSFCNVLSCPASAPMPAHQIGAVLSPPVTEKPALWRALTMPFAHASINLTGWSKFGKKKEMSLCHRHRVSSANVDKRQLISHYDERKQ